MAGDEGTFIGVADPCIWDEDHDADLLEHEGCWLYSAYSGRFYNGRHTKTASKFTTGDIITITLNMEAGTLTFQKNLEAPELAFEGIRTRSKTACNHCLAGNIRSPC
jgi:hypothetical protein